MAYQIIIKGVYGGFQAGSGKLWLTLFFFHSSMLWETIKKRCTNFQTVLKISLWWKKIFKSIFILFTAFFLGSTTKTKN